MGTILDKVPFAVDLPGEPIPGQPLVEICGQKRVLIEHHRGVVHYENDEIRVRVKFGQIRITGSCLRLAKMTKHQLVICGNIESVSLCSGGRS